LVDYRCQHGRWNAGGIEDCPEMSRLVDSIDYAPDEVEDMHNLKTTVDGNEDENQAKQGTVGIREPRRGRLGSKAYDM
jgi:hypothetical protein